VNIIMVMMMAMMTMNITMVTMEIRSCVRVDDLRFYSDQKVDELRRLSQASATIGPTDPPTDGQTNRLIEMRRRI